MKSYSKDVQQVHAYAHMLTKTDEDVNIVSFTQKFVSLYHWFLALTLQFAEMPEVL